MCDDAAFAGENGTSQGREERPWGLGTSCRLEYSVQPFAKLNEGCFHISYRRDSQVDIHVTFHRINLARRLPRQNKRLEQSRV